MGRNRVERLMVLTWAFLLLGLVQGWKHISEEQLKEILQGRFSRVSVDPDDHAKLSINFDNDDDADDEEDEDDLFYDSEGEATEDDFDPEPGFQRPKVTAVPTPDSEGEATEDIFGPEPGFQGPPVKAVLTPDPNEDSTGFDFDCTQSAFIISMSKKELDKVQVIGMKDLLPVEEAPESCGYNANHKKGTLTVPFSGCLVKNEKSGYSLQLLFAEGSQVRTAYCDAPKPGKTGLSLHARVAHKSPPDCPFCIPHPPTEGPPFDSPEEFHVPDSPLPEEPRAHRQAPLPHNCAVNPVEQINCGYPGMSSSECARMGCCVNPLTLSCYYPVDECTEDRHFVFAIRSDSASVPLNPRTLFIPGTGCTPVITTDTVAVFKFKMTECGTRTFNVGVTQIYLAEVQSPVESLNLKYGVISRSNPVRFIVECRYSPSVYQSLASTGYMVKTPSTSLPSAVTSDGLYGVELKIAEDGTYSSFYPTYHQPLRLLLGKPVYFQLLLLSPTPEAVILVNYCIAYPRSATNALVLVYEGCANPNDPQTAVLINSGFTQSRNERRFMVKAFQFMNQQTNQYLDEEIYFMCSTEVCFPAERQCEDSCFDGMPQP